jgi:hypothetical protein
MTVSLAVHGGSYTDSDLPSVITGSGFAETIDGVGGNDTIYDGGGDSLARGHWR